MKNFLLLAALALCFTGAAARAQGVGGASGDGPCDSSPENPTLILAALGSSGAGLAALRMRWKARGAKK